jgi:hypothetical protein
MPMVAVVVVVDRQVVEEEEEGLVRELAYPLREAAAPEVAVAVLLMMEMRERRMSSFRTSTNGTCTPHPIRGARLRLFLLFPICSSLFIPVVRTVVRGLSCSLTSPRFFDDADDGADPASCMGPPLSIRDTEMVCSFPTQSV